MGVGTGVQEVHPCSENPAWVLGTKRYRGATGWLLGGGWNLGSVVQMANGWAGLRATFESYPSVRSQLCCLMAEVDHSKRVS